jgi:hypothetical protein
MGAVLLDESGSTTLPTGMRTLNYNPTQQRLTIL